MKIILEGPDGVGKTTVGKILADYYGFDLVHFTGNDPKDYMFYLETARKESVIYDRHTIGELVYPHVFDRKQEILPDEAQAIINKSNAYVFILTADTDEIRSRITSRGYENGIILKNLQYINAKFVTLSYELKNVQLINTTNLIPDEVAENITTYIKENPKHDN